MADNASAAAAAVAKTSMYSFFGDGASTAVMVALTVLVLVLVVVVVYYVVYLLKTRGKKQESLIKGSEHLVRNAQTISSLPPPPNDLEYAYTCWLYLQDVRPSTSPKPILRRGSTANSFHVFMDSAANRVYVSMPTRDVKGSGSLQLADLIPSSSGYGATNFLTAEIDYLPLQRWVHLAVVIRQDTMTVFVNGDIYTVRSVADKNAMFAPVSGELKVGATDAPDAFISRLVFHNYAPLHDQIQKDFKRGPASSLGLGGYKLRSPIVRVDDERGSCS